jgi:hypothetical protein
MRADAWGRLPAERERHVEPRAALLSQAPRSRGVAVAQHGPRPARKYRCHAPAVSAEDTVPDRVHASVHRMKPPALDPVIDRVPTDPEAPELPKRDDPVLPLGEPPDRPIDPPSVGLSPIAGQSTPASPMPPSLPGGDAPVGYVCD